MKFIKGCLLAIGAGVAIVVVIGIILVAIAPDTPTTTRSGTSQTLVQQSASAAVATSAPEVPTVTPPPPMVFNVTNWHLLESNPDAYIGSRAEIVGTAFGSIERDDQITYWQMWANPKEYEGNTAVMFRDPNFPVKEDDYVRVVGVVRGSGGGQNAFGATISAVIIEAESAEIVDGLAAASPAIRAVDVNQELNQHGLVVRLAKVEYAADETRVHLVVNNTSALQANFYRFNAKAVQGNTQYETEYSSMYPEVQSDLLPGIQSPGVFVFPPMDPAVATTFYFDGRTSDYSLEFTNYIFTVAP